MAADERTDAGSGDDSGAAAEGGSANRTVSTPEDQSGASRKRVRATEGQVGQTLRTVYQQTVNEDIPSDLLDLLGKLA